MRHGQPNQSKSVLKSLVLFLLASLCLFLVGCQYWYQDMKGFLEHWTGTVSIGDVSWNASPTSQKNASGVDTISTNATITATVDILNPDGYPLDGGIGSAADAIRSVRISGAAGSAALAKASVISSSSTSMEIEIAPLSMIPTQESLGLEHTNFTVEFAPTRSDNALQSSAHRSLTLRYNTPPRMPLEVVEDGGTLKFLDGNKQWGPVTGSQEPALNGYIFWAYPSGITDSTHPDCVASFRVTDGTHIEEQVASAYLMAQNPTLSSLIPKDLVDRGYELYCYSVSTPTVATKVEAVDNEGVSSYSAESGRTIYEIILNANGGSFGSRGTVIVFRAAGAALNGGDLDIPSRSGHYLSGWTVGGSPVTFPYTVSEPLTLTARWTANPSSDGGGSDGGASGEGDSDAGASGGGESDDGAGDIGVPSTYTVTFNAAGGKFADGKDSLAETVQGNNKVTEPTPPTRGGWVFTWWKDPATGSAYDFSKPVTSNLTLTANWTQEFYVSPSNGDDTNLGTQDKPLKNLQAAVDKIDGLNDGTSTYTILLVGDVDDSSSGSYDSGKNSALVNIVPTKTLSLTIKSDTDGVTRIINAGRNATNTGRVMYVGGANTTVTLKDLTVTGGNSDDLGGGIHITGGNVTLHSVEVINNTSKNAGGGIYMDGGSLTLTDSNVSDNESANSSGGGIHIESGSAALTDSIIGGNEAKGTSGNGGGICCGGKLTLKGTTSVTGNTATNGGGGILVGQNGEVTIAANSTVTISGNKATNGGGVYVIDGTLSMSGGEIYNNAATDSGGGVYVYGDTDFGTLSMAGGTIGKDGSPNTASNGGGIAVNGSTGMVFIDGGNVSYNEAATNGGGIYLFDGEVMLTKGNVSNNKATNSGGGVYVVTGKAFSMSGGAISDNAATASSGKGGGIYLGGNLNMTGGKISGNTVGLSGSGAGIYDSETFNLGGSAYISPDNPVFLFNKIITITSSLTATVPVATIEPNGYGTTQVLAAGSGVNLASEVGKFAVVPDTFTSPGSSIPYFVEVNPSDQSQGVLAKGMSVTGAEAAAEIAKLSGSETYTVRVTGELTEEQIIGTDGIKDKLIELVNSQPNTKVVLDLSSTNITALPANAFCDPGIPLMGINGTPLDNVVGVVLPGTLKGIGDSAFSSCTNLTAIDIPASVTTLGHYAFSSTGLTEITIPDSVTQVGNGVFSNCAALKDVTFSANMDTISNAMFSDSGLEIITIPATITTIQYQAFQDCNSLNNVVFVDTSSTWTVTEDALPNATVNNVSVADAGNNATLLKTTYYLYNWTKNN